MTGEIVVEVRDYWRWADTDQDAALADGTAAWFFAYIDPDDGACLGAIIITGHPGITEALAAARTLGGPRIPALLVDAYPIPLAAVPPITCDRFLSPTIADCVTVALPKQHRPAPTAYHLHTDQRITEDAPGEYWRSDDTEEH